MHTKWVFGTAIAVSLVLCSNANAAKWIVPDARTPTGFSSIEVPDEAYPSALGGGRYVIRVRVNGLVRRVADVAYKDQLVRIPRPIPVPPVTIAARGENPDLVPDNGLPLRAHAANRIPELHAQGTDGRGIRVAILDTGLAPSAAGMIDGVDYWPEGAWADDHGHGTAVAGIIAGWPPTEKYIGVAPRAALFVAKVLDANGVGRDSTVIEALNEAAEWGAQIVNLSLGGEPQPQPDPLELACENLVTKGIIVVAACGNEGNGLQYKPPLQIGSPACSALLFAVGSVSGDDRFSGFSSRGPSIRGHTSPDCVGFGHIVPCAIGEGTHMIQQEIKHTGYGPCSGTSLVCPYAVGLCTLALQLGILASEVRSRLLAHCSVAVTQLPDSTDPANCIGAGAVRGGDALLPPPPSPEPEPEPPGGCGGQASNENEHDRYEWRRAIGWVLPLGLLAFALGCMFGLRRRPH